MNINGAQEVRFSRGGRAVKENHLDKLKASFLDDTPVFTCVFTHVTLDVLVDLLRQVRQPHTHVSGKSRDGNLSWKAADGRS